MLFRLSLLVGQLVITWLLLATLGNSQEERNLYVSEASHIIGTYRPRSFETSPDLRCQAAKAFLESLTESQRKKAQFPLNDPERKQWTNLPPGPNDLGLRLGEMDQAQTKNVCELLAKLFSQTGYTKYCDIMLADDQLLAGGRPRNGLGTDNFAVLIFGDPSPDGTWAFQLDGHHIGVNLTLQGEQISISPSFIGTQPESFQIGQRVIRPLTREIDDAYRLVHSLSDDQRKVAVVSSKRGLIRTGPGTDGQIPDLHGVACSTFDNSQRDVLTRLVDQWINDLPEPQASQLRQKFRDQIEQAYFSWNGSLKDRGDISYGIMSPDFIVEFACQGPPDRPLDHIHTMFRNPRNEYGESFQKSR